MTKRYKAAQIRQALADYEMDRQGDGILKLKLDPVAIAQQLLEFLEGKRQ